jgi:hypothetical protein
MSVVEVNEEFEAQRLGSWKRQRRNKDVFDAAKSAPNAKAFPATSLSIGGRPAHFVVRSQAQDHMIVMGKHGKTKTLRKLCREVTPT